MEYEYINFLIQNLIHTNKNFAKKFHAYQIENIYDKGYKITYDDELISIIVKILKSGIEYDFSNYEKLDKLYYYINNFLLQQDKNKVEYTIDDISRIIDINKKNSFKELFDYGFHDSKLIKLEIDPQNSKCRLYLHSVMVCGDKRKNKEYGGEEYDVEVGDIIITFTEVKDIKFIGRFDFLYGYGDVYSSKEQKIDDSINRFTLLCIVDYERFMMEITFTHVKVEDFDYHNSKVYPKSQ